MLLALSTSFEIVNISVNQKNFPEFHKNKGDHLADNVSEPFFQFY